MPQLEPPADARMRHLGRSPIVAALLVAALLACHQRPALAQTSSIPGAEEEDDDDNDLGLYVLGGLAAAIVGTAPLWGPARLLDDDFSATATFLEHPYQGGQPGYLCLGNQAMPGTTIWGATAASDYGFDGDIQRLGTRLAVDTQARFGLDTEWNHLWGELEGRPWDEMQTGDFHFTVRFAQHSHAQFRAGAGFRWLSDELDTNYGFSGTYGIDVQPVRPLVLSLSLEAGTLRHDPFFHGRASAGLVWKHAEVFAGFDYLQIDEVEAAGPMIGLRIWL